MLYIKGRNSGRVHRSINDSEVPRNAKHLLHAFMSGIKQVYQTTEAVRAAMAGRRPYQNNGGTSYRFVAHVR